MDINELLKTENKLDRLITIPQSGVFLNKEQWNALWNYFEANSLFLCYNEEEQLITISVDEHGEKHKTE